MFETSPAALCGTTGMFTARSFQQMKGMLSFNFLPGRRNSFGAGSVGCPQDVKNGGTMGWKRI